MLALTPHLATWLIAGLATLGVILRPFAWPEAVWAVAGAALLVLVGLISWSDAAKGVASGLDVYLFLIGMMLLAEVARKEGLFDWLAGIAVRAAKGSATRLFLLVYAVGTLVTVFLSNDACAVVLTPAVYAAARTARVEPLPYLLVCAFIANAASFVLPISNPANLVVYGAHMPPLADWLRTFTLPSLAAILATYIGLRVTQAGILGRQVVADQVDPVPLGRGGLAAAWGIAATAVLLLGASATGRDLGPPTLVAGLATTLLVVALGRSHLVAVLKDVSWGVLPLVAGLFVLVEALAGTGLLGMLADLLRASAAAELASTAWAGGLAAGFGANLVNNLPAGLFAGAAVQGAEAPHEIAAAILIGIDLGPNLSVTGSLATILWLTAIRREGQHVSAWAFLKIGLLVMPPALVLALAALILV